MDKVRILKRGETVPPYFFIKEDQNSEKLKGASTSNIDPDDLAFFAGWQFGSSAAFFSE